MTSNAVVTSPAPKRRRRRPATSCEPCRERRVKCNQELPCSACVRSRGSLVCVYRDSGPASASSSAKSLAVRVNPSPSRTGRELRTSTIVAKDTTQSQKTTGVPQNVDKDDNTSQSKDQDNSTSATSSVEPVCPRLRHVPEKTKLFGQTHWIHTAENLPVSGEFHPVEVEPSFFDAKTELYENLKKARALRQAIKAENSIYLSVPIKELAATLPTRRRCEVLSESYFRTLGSIYRVLHVPEFWKDFESIWNLDGTQSVSEVFLVKLVLVMAMGATFAEPENDEERITFRRLAQTWIQSVQTSLSNSYGKLSTTFDGIQVFALLLLAVQTTHDCRGLPTWLSEASLMRMAVTMGLHRDPTIFPTLSPYHKEMRKRLWVAVLELNVQCSLDSSIPLEVTAYDTPLPSNVNDSELKPTSLEVVPQNNEITDSSLQILLANSLPLRLRVIQHLNDFRHPQQYDTSSKLAEELKVACKDISTFFDSNAANYMDSPSLMNISITGFHRRLLDLQLRRIILFLHRPFMLRARTDPRFYLSRKVCIDACMIILSSAKGHSSHPKLIGLDDLWRLSLVGRGFFKCQMNFDAILALALEIISQLQEELSSGYEAEVLNDMAKAARAPLVRILEDIMEQSLQVIQNGSTSMKRYLFVTGLLQQIRAMEEGRPLRPALYEATSNALKKCHSILEQQRSAQTPQYSLTTSDESMPSTLLFDMQDQAMMDWDLSNLLYFPGLTDQIHLQS